MGTGEAKREGEPVYDFDNLRQQIESQPSTMRWLLPALLTIFFLAVVGILTLPVLFSPPVEGPSDGTIDVGASTDLDPSHSHLAETRDRSIAVFVPEQAFPAGGRLILQPRRPELIPDRISNRIERVLAVDLLVIDAAGEVVSDVTFNASPILCFRPNEYYRTMAEAGQSEIFVQRYDEGQIPVAWVKLDLVMGWEGDQVCAGLDHLSLFALASKPSDVSRLPFGGDDPPPEMEPGVERLYAPAGMP
jgi:hypothetical protein